MQFFEPNDPAQTLFDSKSGTLIDPKSQSLEAGADLGFSRGGGGW